MRLSATPHRSSAGRSWISTSGRSAGTSRTRRSSSPAPEARSAPSCVDSSVRLGVAGLVLVDQAEAARRRRQEARRRSGVPERGAGPCGHQEPRVDCRGLRGASPRRRLPCGGVQARALLEASPTEGVATNVLGTKCVVDAARRTHVGRFVLFSTDKAVEPASILGQTKAVAEWIVATAGREAAHGRYTSVRLANVVDSTGSILPVFREQVARGGPLTITHPAVTRYLMTADEAANLAIVAGGLADSNGIFWLDCGPP